MSATGFAAHPDAIRPADASDRVSGNGAATRWRLSQEAAALAHRIAMREPSDHEPDCDVLIVGSGYGGAVAAARLAGTTVEGRDGKPRAAKIWLLERGTERLPGTFPSRIGELPGDVRFSGQDVKVARGHAIGLFDVRLGENVHALVANGLGGGSLINAGVMERPLPSAFNGWPRDLSDPNAPRPTDLDSLRPHYDEATRMLMPAQLPPDADLPGGQPLRKLEALKATARGKQARMDAARVAVSFVPQQTLAGVGMAACTHCGDCITGCNQGAKNTLDTNYLAFARRRKVEMFCGGWVDWVERDRTDDHWNVHWRYTAPGQRQRDPAPILLRAKNVILAAGSLGSTEILLRSRHKARLTLSPCLGHRFSTNGDAILAGFRQTGEVNACADEDSNPAVAAARKVGPTVCGVIRSDIDLNAGSNAASDVVPITIEEFAVPAALGRLLGEVTTTFGTLHDLFTRENVPHPADVPGGEDPLAVTTSSIRYTSIYGVMGDDGAGGRIELTIPGSAELPAGDGMTRIVWPGLKPRLGTLFDAQMAWLKDACAGAGGPGGTVVPNPTWRPLPPLASTALGTGSGAALTVHPLGGCPMGEAAEDSVVNWCGSVFNPAGGVHAGLAVLDGAIVPSALAINPALTIAALAERAVPALAASWGLRLAQAPEQCDLAPAALLRRRPPPGDAGAATAIVIREQMVGPLTMPNGQPLWAELEIHFEPIADLACWLKTVPRSLSLPLPTERSVAELRLYAPFLGAGDEIADRPSPRPPLASVRLTGSVQVFAPAQDEAAEQIANMAVLDALVHKLSLRVILQAVTGKGNAGERESLYQFVANVAAERRLLQYQLRVEAADTAAAEALAAVGLAAGDELLGTKVVGFGVRTNPWRQLSTLDMQWQRSASPARPIGTLKSDLGYFARYREALLTVREQRDQTTAWCDLAAFALLALRVVLRTHLLAFAPPDDAAPRIDGRAPGMVAGQRPTVFELDADTRLSRYLPPQRAAATRPLLLIHGLSASGSTFTHPAIPGNMVQFMLERGRDVWVLDLRTSAANEHRPGPYSFEQTALGDIPRAIDKILDASDQQKIDVFAHCIGSAMFCMAVLAHPTLHRSIGHAVLSQVGPVMAMSPLNRLRGFVAGALEQYLSVEEFDVRFDFEKTGGQWQRKNRGMGATLLDALLATFDYPENDTEAARAKLLDTLRGEARDFRRVRHRADAIVGHAFELENIGDETLLALDAIFGWVKTRTLSQVQHFARQGVLTNAAGSNHDVADSSLRERFAFPVLLLHGRRNQVFAARGARSSYRLLKRVFNEAPGTNAATNGDLHLGIESPRQLYVLDRYGHQDPIIGKSARFDVFPVVERFLVSSESAAARAVAEGAPPRLRYFCEEPWIGPRLGWLRAQDPGPSGRVERFDVSLQVHPGPRNAQSLCVVLIPAERVATAGDRGGRPWRFSCEDARAYTLGARGPEKRQRELLLMSTLKLTLRPAADRADVAFAVLTLHADAGGLPLSEFSMATESEDVDRVLQEGMRLAPDATLAVSRFIARAREVDRLMIHFSSATFHGADLAAAGLEQGLGRPLAFALGSCLYPPGLFDRRIADATMKHLTGRVQAPDGDDVRPSFLLLMGDQIYRDATAVALGLPNVGVQDVLRNAYETSWRLDGFRVAGGRLPTYSMIDDHEIADNWQPPAAPSDGLGDDEIAALTAYHHYQGKLNPQPEDDSSLAYTFAPAGMPFFVLDTRTRRDLRRIDRRASWKQAQIIPAMNRLKDWLKRNEVAPIKFIGSPSVVFPLPAGYDPATPRVDLDSWAGYPASLAALLSYIRQERITNVVFLSGDEHLSLVSRLQFDNGVVVHSVVASGLHAPWIFANSRREDFALDGRMELNGWAADVSTKRHMVCDASNYVVVTVLPAQRQGGSRLKVEISPVVGKARTETYDLATAPPPVKRKVSKRPRLWDQPMSAVDTHAMQVQTERSSK